MPGLYPESRPMSTRLPRLRRAVDDRLRHELAVHRPHGNPDEPLRRLQLDRDAVGGIRVRIAADGGRDEPLRPAVRALADVLPGEGRPLGETLDEADRRAKNTEGVAGGVVHRGFCGFTRVRSRSWNTSRVSGGTASRRSNAS